MPPPNIVIVVAANVTMGAAAAWGTDRVHVCALQVLQSREYMDAVLERTPMKRVGKPEEVAGAAQLIPS